MRARTPRTSVITDWRVRDEDKLPDVPPGEGYERQIAPQKFVVLHRVVVRGMSLAQLGIGAVSSVPFELDSVDGDTRYYRPCGLDAEAIKKSLVKVGAAVAGPNAIAIAPALEVRLLLVNEGTTAAKPRAAIVVQEEE